MTLVSPTIELDKEFEVYGAVTKAWTDGQTGDRFIQGVVSGLDEDRDGERVSARCIEGMVGKVRAGGVKATASHQQDWFTEFGDATEAFYDAESGEMVGKVRLPPAGEDPVADKAWRTVQRGGLGWSIGGKLKGAFFEKTEMGKRRKVLDQVDLRHFCLTSRPAYSTSFAEVVGKTFDGDPDDAEFVEKDMAGPAGAPGRDSNTGDRNAGDSSSGSLKTEQHDDDDDDDDTKGDKAKLPKSPERHLACPNCGHEFAADLPDDRGDAPDDATDDEGENDDKATSKTLAEEIDMTLTDTLAELRSIVAKATGDPDPDPDVSKELTSDEDGAVVAKAIVEVAEHIEQLEDRLAAAFETIAKSQKAVIEELRSRPVGRRSIARMPEGGLPPATGHDGTVAKTVDQLIAETDDPVEALKVLNSETYGIRA